MSVVEYHEHCAKKFKKLVKHLFIGDQSDLNFLKMVGEKGGIYDIIVDDGGHTRKQQITSLIGLWPFIRSNGGIYVFEDIFTSFVEDFNDNPQESTIDLMAELMVLLSNPNQKNYLNITINHHAKVIYQHLNSLICFSKICILIKK